MLDFNLLNNKVKNNCTLMSKNKVLTSIASNIKTFISININKKKCLALSVSEV